MAAEAVAQWRATPLEVSTESCEATFTIAYRLDPAKFMTQAAGELLRMSEKGCTLIHDGRVRYQFEFGRKRTGHVHVRCDGIGAREHLHASYARLQPFFDAYEDAPPDFSNEDVALFKRARTALKKADGDTIKVRSGSDTLTPMINIPVNVARAMQELV